jgi:hypothetical protein
MLVKASYKPLLSFLTLLTILFLTSICRSSFAQQSVLFSWQGTINPPVVTNQVWGDHDLFQKGTGYQQFVVAINQGYGASITATASGPVFLYVVPDEYAAPWYWVGDYYPGSDFTLGDSAYIDAATYNGANLNVQFWAPKDDTWHFVFYNEGKGIITANIQAMLLEPADVSINVSPSETITYGQSVIISGTVATAGTPLQNGDIALMLTQGYGQDQTLANVAPQNGQYSYRWTPNAGTYTLYAEWSGNGDYQATTSQQVQVTVNKMPVSMQVQPVAKVELDPIFQSPGQVTISGQLTPAIQGAQIAVNIGSTVPDDLLSQNLFNPSASSPQFSAVTDVNGQFTMQIPIAKPGAWQAVLSWDGDANHLSASQTITIEAEWNYTPYIIALAIILLAVGLIVYKTRKRIPHNLSAKPFSSSLPQNSSNTLAQTERMRKAKELLDAGLITHQEFDSLMKNQGDAR